MSVQKILLQLDYIKILRHRKHWNLYLTIATGVPNDPSKMAITVIPQNGKTDGDLIKLRRSSNNEIHFVPEGDTHGNGLFIFEQDIPDNKMVDVRVWLMQSRKAARKTGDILGEISGYLKQNTVIQDVAGLLGTGSQWAFVENVANDGLTGVGHILSNLSDRNLGFVSMDKLFTADFEQNKEIDLHNKTSTGMAEIGWTWYGV